MRSIWLPRHFSGRHLRPPTHTVVQDLSVKGANPQLAIYKTFPIARIASAVKVPLVEPSYIAHATRFLLQSTIPDRSELIDDLNNEVDLGMWRIQQSQCQTQLFWGAPQISGLFLAS